MDEFLTVCDPTEMTMISATNTAITAAVLLLFFGGTTTGPPARGGERHVRLANDARQPIVEIYVSDDGHGGWQGDLLGSDFLMPGGSVFVDLPDRNGNCRVDVKAVLNDGSIHIERGVRICLDDGHAVSLQ
jgi:hypothetical protein